jgi:hypothetical protein
VVSLQQFRQLVFLRWQFRAAAVELLKMLDLEMSVSLGVQAAAVGQIMRE